MTINKELEGTELNVELEGELDTNTAPRLQELFDRITKDITVLNLDFSKLDYISSAGLRVLLRAQKTMNKQGKMVIRGCNKNILEMFEVTGFSDILTLE